MDNVCNETKKEVNDGLCGKSAPCCRGPRPRLSRARHRLVIDWIQLLRRTRLDTVDISRRTDRYSHCYKFFSKNLHFERRHVNDNAESPDKWNVDRVSDKRCVDRIPSFCYCCNSITVICGYLSFRFKNVAS